MMADIEQCINIQKHTTTAKQLLVSRPKYQVVDDLPTGIDPYVQAGRPEQRQAAGQILSEVMNLPEETISPITIGYQQENAQRQEQQLDKISATIKQSNNEQQKEQQSTETAQTNKQATPSAQTTGAQQKSTEEAVDENVQMMEKWYSNEHKTGVGDIAKQIEAAVVSRTKEPEQIKNQLLKSGQFCCSVKYITFVWYLIDMYSSHPELMYTKDQEGYPVPLDNKSVYSNFISYINKDMENLKQQYTGLNLESNIDNQKNIVKNTSQQLINVLRPVDSLVSSTSYIYDLGSQVLNVLSKVPNNQFIDILETFMSLTILSQLSIMVDLQNKFVKDNVTKLTDEIDKYQKDVSAGYYKSSTNPIVKQILETHRYTDLTKYLLVQYFNNTEFDEDFQHSKSPQQVIMQNLQQFTSQFTNNVFGDVLNLTGSQNYDNIIKMLDTLYSFQNQNKISINFKTAMNNQQKINQALVEEISKNPTSNDTIMQAIFKAFGLVGTTETSYVAQTFNIFSIVIQDIFSGNQQNIGTDLNNQINQLAKTYGSQSDKNTQSVQTTMSVIMNQLVQQYFQYIIGTIDKTYQFNQKYWNDFPVAIYGKYTYDKNTDAEYTKKCVYMRSAQDEIAQYIASIQPKQSSKQQKCGNIFEQVYSALIWVDPLQYMPVINMIADYIMKQLYTMTFKFLTDVQHNSYNISIKANSINLHLVDLATSITNTIVQQLDIFKQLIESKNIELITNCISATDIKSLKPSEEELKAIDELDQPISDIIKNIINILEKILNF